MGGRNYIFNICTTEQKQHLKFLWQLERVPWNVCLLDVNIGFGGRMGNLENRATAERALRHTETRSAGTGYRINRDWASEQEKDDVFVYVRVSLCVFCLLFFLKLCKDVCVGFCGRQWQVWGLQHSLAVGDGITRPTEKYMCVCGGECFSAFCICTTYVRILDSKTRKTVCQYTVTVAVESNEVITTNGNKRWQKANHRSKYMPTPSQLHTHSCNQLV